MQFNLELSGEQVHIIRMALMRLSNQAHQDGDDARSLKLDEVEGCILNQVYAQRELQEAV